MKERRRNKYAREAYARREKEALKDLEIISKENISFRRKLQKNFNKYKANFARMFGAKNIEQRKIFYKYLTNKK